MSSFIRLFNPHDVMITISTLLNISAHLYTVILLLSFFVCRYFRSMLLHTLYKRAYVAYGFGFCHLADSHCEYFPTDSVSYASSRLYKV